MANNNLGHLTVAQPSIGEQLLRALDMKGPGPSLLTPELRAQILLEDLTRPEYDYLRRTQRWSGCADSAAVAGQFSHVVFGANSPGTRALCVIDRIIISNTSAVTLFFRYGQHLNTIGISPTGPSSPGPLDDRPWRLDGTNIPFSMFSASSFANAGQILVADAPSLSLLAGTAFTIQLGCVVTGRVVSGGNINFYVQAGTVNAQFSAAFFWRERELLSSEL